MIVSWLAREGLFGGHPLKGFLSLSGAWRSFFLGGGVEVEGLVVVGLRR